MSSQDLVLYRRPYVTKLDYENKSKLRCLEVQRDPYGYLMTAWDRQWAKQFPARTVFNSIFISVWSVYYLSKHKEFNRIRRL